MILGREMDLKENLGVLCWFLVHVATQNVLGRFKAYRKVSIYTIL